MADKLTIEHQPSSKLFDLLISTLSTLSTEPNRLKQKLTVAAFQLKALQILGFYSLQRPFFFKSVAGAVINSILQLSPEELSKSKFEPRNINTIFEDSRILVEEVAEKQIKSSKFVEELDNYHQVSA